MFSGQCSNCHAWIDALSGQCSPCHEAGSIAALVKFHAPREIPLAGSLHSLPTLEDVPAPYTPYALLDLNIGSLGRARPVSYKAQGRRDSAFDQRLCGLRSGVSGISKRHRAAASLRCKGDDLEGLRVEVPASHGNKYGYSTGATIVATSHSRCLIRLDITSEERWHPAALVQRWINPDVERLSSALCELRT
jgi:hypothetical protein